ncbi:MAG: hypothetical protein CFE32_18170, partial [Alphaproteobacteria bacterium PA3]
MDTQITRPIHRPAAQLREARRQLDDSGQAPVALLGEALARSWQRSHGAGLPTQGANTTRSWATTPNGLMFSNNTTNFADYSLVRLAGPQSWGGSLAPIPGLQTSVSNIPTVGPAQAQDGFVNTGVFDEHLNSVRLEGVGTVDYGWVKKINFGVAYTDHAKSKNNHGAFLTANTWPLDGPIPAGSRKGVADLAWAGLGQVVA